MTMFFRRRTKDRQAASRLAEWALSEAGNASELERAYGREHAEELGSLGWLFRAIESEVRQIPSLGLWQRFERDLRLRLQLLPPPRSAMASILPPLFILPMVPSEVKTAVGASVWKAAAVASATATLSLHLAHEGVDLRPLRGPAVAVECARIEFSPTGNPVLDHIQRNRVALQGGEISAADLGSLSEASPTALQ